MNIDDLQFNVRHATETDRVVSINVKEMLDSDIPDSIKKTILIEYLSTLQVEVQFLRDQLSKILDEQLDKQKKFRLFKR
jgi:hypothetical protein